MSSTASAVSDLAEIYRKLTPAERSRHVAGQVFWIPAYLAMQDYHVVRIGWWDRTHPISEAKFKIEKRTIQTIGHESDLYQHMPIPELKIGMDEELVVKKVKRRPAVLIWRDGFDPRKYARFSTGGTHHRPEPTTHVFAPVFSLRKADNVSQDYPEAFIQGLVDGDKYPDFLHLPAEGTVIKNESMAVLGQLQTHSEAHIEETDLALTRDYLALALEQFWKFAESRLYLCNE
jgi:hypothetical protein